MGAAVSTLRQPIIGIDAFRQYASDINISERYINIDETFRAYANEVSKENPAATTATSAFNKKMATRHASDANRDGVNSALFLTGGMGNDNEDISNLAISSIAAQSLLNRTDAIMIHCRGQDELGRDICERVRYVNDILRCRGVVTWFKYEDPEVTADVDTSQTIHQNTNNTPQPVIPSIPIPSTRSPRSAAAGNGNNKQLQLNLTPNKAGKEDSEQVVRCVHNTSVGLVFITKRYLEYISSSAPAIDGDRDRNHCKKEFLYSFSRLGPLKLIPIYMEPNLKDSWPSKSEELKLLTDFIEFIDDNVEVVVDKIINAIATRASFLWARRNVDHKNKNNALLQDHHLSSLPISSSSSKGVTDTEAATEGSSDFLDKSIVWTPCQIVSIMKDCMVDTVENSESEGNLIVMLTSISRIQKGQKKLNEELGSLGLCELVVRALEHFTRRSSDSSDSTSSDIIIEKLLAIVIFLCRYDYSYSTSIAENLTRFGDTEMCEVVHKLISLNRSNNLPLLRNLFMVINSLSSNDNNCIQLGNIGCCEATIAALATFGSQIRNPKNSSTSSFSSSSSTSTSSSKLSLSPNFQDQHDITNINVQILGAVSSLAYVDANATKLSAAGCCEAIIQMVKGLSKFPMPLAEQLCSSIANLAFNNSNNLKLLGCETCIAEMVVNALVSYGSSGSFSEVACRSIRYLLLKNDGNKGNVQNIFSQSGACEAVTITLCSHKASCGAATEEACLLIAALANGDTLSKSKFRLCGCLEELANTLHINLNNASVTQKACKAIKNLAFNDKTNIVRLGLLCHADIITALNIHRQSMQVSKEICWVVSNICVTDSNRSIIGNQEGALETIAEVVIYHIQVKEIQSIAIKALKNLIFDHKSNQQKLRQRTDILRHVLDVRNSNTGGVSAGENVGENVKEGDAAEDGILLRDPIVTQIDEFVYLMETGSSSGKESQTR